MKQAAVTKDIIRKIIRDKEPLTPSVVTDRSEIIAQKLLNHRTFELSKVLCVYLSMQNEVQTMSIIDAAFSMGKRVIIPKVVGKSPSGMIMLEIKSVEEISSFPKSKWGIPEPPPDFVDSHPDLTEAGIIDTVYVPGVAFDTTCGRIGYGRGYYGK